MKFGIVVGVVIVIAALVICLRPTTPSNYIYEDGRVLVGADGEPIELINNPNATNPTYAMLVDFINEDPTDEGAYMRLDSNSSFAFLGRTCGDFAEAVHNNAEAAGIRAALVTIDFEGQDVGHALNAFETTDKGLIYIDCTGQDLGSWIADHFVKLDKITGKVYFIQESLRSWDKVAYVEVGKEYGLIPLDKAESLSYNFYEEYEWKWQNYERLLDDYNDEVAQYNQEIEGKIYYEGTPELASIEAWETTLRQQEQELDELKEELGDFRFEPLGIVEDINVYWGNS
jgi:hypothetical protein